MDNNSSDKSHNRPPLSLPFYYGWFVISLCFLTTLTSAGVRSSPSVLIHPLEAEFGWSRTLIASAVSMNLLLFGILARHVVQECHDHGARSGAPSHFLAVGRELLCLRRNRQRFDRYTLNSTRDRDRHTANRRGFVARHHGRLEHGRDNFFRLDDRSR